MTSDQQERERLGSVYRDYSKLPLLSAGVISFGHDVEKKASSVQLTYSQRDLYNNTNRTFSKTFDCKGIFDQKGSLNELPSLLGFPVDHSENIVLTSLSPSRRRKIQIKKASSDGANGKSNDSTTYYIELWDQNCGVITKQISTGSLHGKIANDGNFTTISWNHDETKILYEAEVKQKQPNHLWEPKNKDKDVSKSSGDDEDLHVNPDRYDISCVENFGEGLFIFTLPRLFLCDFEQENIVEIKSIPPYLAVSSARFCPNNDLEAIFVGYDTRERRLGLKYCQQRKTALYHLKDFQLEKSKENKDNAIELLSNTETDWNVLHPNFSPCGKYLVYFTTGKVPYHLTCVQLVLIEWSSDKLPRMKKVLVDFVSQPSSTDAFPGIYETNFHLRCWSNDSSFLLIESSIGCVGGLFAVETTTKNFGKITRIHPTIDNHSLSLLDHESGYILCNQTSPNTPFHVIIGKLNPADSFSVEWRDIEASHSMECTSIAPKTQEMLKKLNWDIVNIPCSGSSYQMQCILIKPEQKTKVPLIAYPHGGPHSVYTTTFMFQPAFFVCMGYALLLINYRGSTGFGQDFVKCLPGNCGEMDVIDVQTATKHVLKQDEMLDKDRVAIMGGSHGGFLGTHMVGQYPDFYKCCIVRNPVINIASMITSTDIPDWCFTESGYDPYTYNYPQGADMIKKMFVCSPIHHVSKVKSPVLLMIGDSDLRVPPSQGKEFYYALKSRNIDTKLMIYPGNAHPIDKPTEEADSVIQSCMWLFKYCK